MLASGSAEKWNFAVLRTGPDAPIRKDALEKSLPAAPRPRSKAIGFDYLVSTERLDDLSTALFRRLEVRPTAFHVYDENALVVADVKPMDDFITSTYGGRTRQPRFLTLPPSAAEPPADKPAEGA